MIDLTIIYDESTVDVAWLAYANAKSDPWPSSLGAEMLPVSELFDRLGGRLGASDGVHAIAIPPPDDLDPISIFTLLIGLRLGLPDNPTESVWGCRFMPDWSEAVMHASPNGVVCLSNRASPLGLVCAQGSAWRAALDTCLEAARAWLRSRLPLLMEDPLLGAWLRGGPIPEQFREYVVPSSRD